MTTNKLRNDLATTDKGKEHFWIKISSQHGATTQISRVDDLKSGAAVTRSLDEIIQFDMDMRKEIFGLVLQLVKVEERRQMITVRLAR